MAGPNGLDLKKIQMRVKFKICFKLGLKIKKKSKGGREEEERAGSPPNLLYLKKKVSRCRDCHF
jgi:hypothetical protein